MISYLRKAGTENEQLAGRSASCCNFALCNPPDVCRMSHTPTGSFSMLLGFLGLRGVLPFLRQSNPVNIKQKLLQFTTVMWTITQAKKNISAKS